MIEQKTDRPDRPVRPLFGPGGNSDSFYAEGNKHTRQAPAWLAGRGLGAYEYEAGNGITAGEETLRTIGGEAARHGIVLSLHAPYYISLAGADDAVRQRSIRHMEKSVQAAGLLGARTVVVHPGGAGKGEREDALRLAEHTLAQALEEIADNGVRIGLETMGMRNQLGTLEEILRLCRLSDRLVPVVDFGHLHARYGGTLFRSADDYRRVFDMVAQAMGAPVAQDLHCHFSVQEWGPAGERRHLTFADAGWGPDYRPFVEAIARDRLTPVVICESAGTMAEDAALMQQYYESFL